MLINFMWGAIGGIIFILSLGYLQFQIFLNVYPPLQTYVNWMNKAGNENELAVFLAKLELNYTSIYVELVVPLFSVFWSVVGFMYSDVVYKQLESFFENYDLSDLFLFLSIDVVPGIFLYGLFISVRLCYHVSIESDLVLEGIPLSTCDGRYRGVWFFMVGSCFAFIASFFAGLFWPVVVIYKGWKYFNNNENNKGL